MMNNPNKMKGGKVRWNLIYILSAALISFSCQEKSRTSEQATNLNEPTDRSIEVPLLGEYTREGNSINHKLKLPPGYYLWGCEVNGNVGVGFIPVDYVSTKEILDVELVSIDYDLSFKSEQLKMSAQIGVFSTEDNSKYARGYRTLISNGVDLLDTPIASNQNGLHRFEYGLVTTPDETLSYNFVLYYSADESLLKKMVPISISVPRWNWDISNLRPEGELLKK